MKLLTVFALLLVTQINSIAATVAAFTGQGYITLGQQYVLNDGNSTVFVSNRLIYATTTTNTEDLYFSFRSIAPHPSNDWTIGFQASKGEMLSVGTYTSAERWSTGDGSKLSFDIFGNGRGSNISTSDVNILEIKRDSGGKIIGIAADFIHYNQKDPNSETIGSLRYNSTLPIPEPSTIGIIAMSIPLLLRRRR